MSLLDDGPDVVTVTPMVAVPGRAGTVDYQPGTPVEVSGGRMQQLSADESARIGVTASSSWRWIGRPRDSTGSRIAWPGGPHSTVSWDGREFDQQGEPLVRRASVGVEHVDR